MDFSTIVAVTLVLIGAAFLFRSFSPAQAARRKVPQELRKQWHTILYLMYFFFAGYLFFNLILIYDIPVPNELVTGGVFLGGAVFVYIVINLSGVTIGKMRNAEEELQSLNVSLEQRVEDRTSELKQSYEFIKTVMNSMQDPILVIDVKTFQIIDVNTAFLDEFTCIKSDVIGKTCYEATHNQTSPCSPPNDLCPLTETIRTKGHSMAEHVHVDGHGEKKYVEVLTSPILDEQGNVMQALHIARDVTERKKATEQIQFLAYYDGLTGLPNRRFYKELLVRAIQYAERYEKILAVLFIDLDGFKRVNDTLGHDAGDQLLKEVGGRLEQCVRKSDYVARQREEGTVPDMVSRIGGDEFIVLLNDVAQGRDAARVAQRMLKSVAAPCTLNGQEVRISASIGIALFPADGKDAEMLLKGSDIAMYHAKEQGKDNYKFYSSSLNKSALERLALEGELRRATEKEEFILHYQPRVAIPGGRVTGLEALVRWNHPSRGLIAPGEFIPLAEEIGLIVQIGQWVLRTACAQHRAWTTAGLPAVPLAVNVSRRQFERQKLNEVVAKVLRESECDPRYLELEITESMIMQDPVKIGEMLSKLRAIGIRIAVDDFGTGYSSLDTLKKLPLDYLKIDRSFVANITAADGDRAIASAIIAMAHSLKLKVIAEGVETEEQLAVLRELGCDEAQGYLFSKPMPPEECERFLRERLKV